MDVRTYPVTALLLGRLVVGGTYLWTATDNLLDISGKAGYAASKGIVEPTLLVPLASLLLLAGAISLIAGLRPALGVFAVVGFLVPVTALMHNYWAQTGVQRIVELHSFQANAIMIGSALMFLAIPRPWPFSVDRWLHSTRRTGSAEASGRTARA